MRREIPLFSKLALGLFVLVFALSLTLGMAYGQADHSQRGLSRAIEVQNAHTEALMAISGVVGTGTGRGDDGKPVIRVYTTRAGIPGIPGRLEDFTVETKVTGMFVALADRTARFPRPVPIGVSTGHPDITAGTIGCRVKDAAGNVYALSNNHVYANSNDASIGDDVIQPGTYDGGSLPDDHIGTLFEFVPINFNGGNNSVDAAIAFSSLYYLGNATLPSPDGYGGTPNSTTVFDLPGFTLDDLLDPAYTYGDVKKAGRTTGLTHGEVSAINVNVNVCYETRGPFRCVKLARFVGQIEITPPTFSAGGDSGSVVVTADGNYPVGLLFAGSDISTIANPIDEVLAAFNVTIDGSSSGNTPPTADFTYTTDNLTANFTDASTDNDGTVVAWSWDFDGDGSEDSTVQNPSHTYATSGTYTVSLTVTDDDGATGSTSQSVTVSDTSGGITLTATGYKVRGRQKADLEWSDATSTNVDIYRDGVLIATTANGGFYTDNIDQRGGGSYTYQVCEEGGTATCSNESTVTF
jgi:PKD repeat protein